MYTLEEVYEISDFLEKQGTFDFSPLSTGLFPAAVIREETQYTGYEQVWIRDNIYVAYAHYAIGRLDIAITILNSLVRYFRKYRKKFELIIASPSIANNVMKRPHVRFSGEKLEEINEKWSHAQNDALGYFLWLYCKLLNEGLSDLGSNADILVLFPLYFNAITYWKDQDSGHWEEERKISASSIGTVKAGLKEMRKSIKLKRLDSLVYKDKSVDLEFIDILIQKGEQALNEILPFECEESRLKNRRYDSALLFLIYPLKVVDGFMADRIVKDVIDNLQSAYGIKRYLLDSFWAANYKKRVPIEKRTIDVSEDMSSRNSLIQEGKEAQWCIFDPIISAIAGLKFQKTEQQRYLEKQTLYLNRSLGQLTGKKCVAGEFKCPELYYLEGDNYVENDATPLLWTQANLRIALKEMEKSLRLL